jgi:hypothetical protein
MQLRLTTDDPRTGSTTSPSQRPTYNTYSLWEEGADVIILQCDDSDGEYSTFKDVKEAAIDRLEDLKRMCDSEIEDIRSADCFEDYLNL